MKILSNLQPIKPIINIVIISINKVNIMTIVIKSELQKVSIYCLPVNSAAVMGSVMFFAISRVPDCYVSEKSSLTPLDASWEMLMNW